MILLIRGQKVIIDSDLALLYGVPTKALNQAIRRNSDRFPEDFMFILSQEEKDEVVTVCDHLKILKYSRHLPAAFTEHGAIMAASILNSERAVKVSLYVVRTFVKLRELLSTNHELATKLSELELKLTDHDVAIKTLVTAIRDLTQPTLPDKRRRVGF